MKYFERTMLWALILVIAVACRPVSGPGETPANPVPTKGKPGSSIPFKTLSQAAPLGASIDSPQYHIVTSSSQWDALEGLFPTQAVEAGRSFDDYDASLVVAVFAGVKGSSGYSIQVEAITEDVNGEVVILVSESHPGVDQIVEPAMTQPYHLVVVSREYFSKGETLVYLFIDQDGRELATAEVQLP